MRYDINWFLVPFINLFFRLRNIYFYIVYDANDLCLSYYCLHFLLICSIMNLLWDHNFHFASTVQWIFVAQIRAISCSWLWIMVTQLIIEFKVTRPFQLVYLVFHQRLYQLKSFDAYLIIHLTHPIIVFILLSLKLADKKWFKTCKAFQANISVVS